MEKELKEKLEKVVELVRNVMADPDIDIDYCIPEVATTSDKCEVNADPYIIVRYTIEEGDTHERKIKLRKKYLEKTAEDLANFITFYIEQFIEEIDSVEYGGE
ncbi:hypothetical protein [Hydrogenivirga sp. 128-5-R1-1]|uniref:hypothetical protein n=1 Tax=Hydrogenivirga sp. 128-5-R1-1 TaxID=392423 RepID=UPI00015F16D9|nr:hypothetical protein [Hydrogenivirga sp. 128-5-R1-1]EDP73262.1 hypothetical protein HG1285_01373 [Hydrogenivirga sp. 128-5-R1-1]